MRGHDDLIQMRKAGRHPGIVFINDYPCKTYWAEWGECATVCVAGDKLEDIEIRFVEGMRVSITGNTKARAKALMDMAIQWGATSVGAGCEDWAEIWHNETEEQNG